MASLFSWGQVTGPELERPVMEALLGARPSALAGMTHSSGASCLRLVLDRAGKSSFRHTMPIVARLPRPVPHH
jgi:hypothetical protein